MPGTEIVGGLLILTTRSIAGDNTVSASVALLLPATGSSVPLLVIVAVLLKRPLAASPTTPVATMVTRPPTGRFTGVLMLPMPELRHSAPPLDVQVHAIASKASGKTSVTVAPTTLLGPLLLATMT